MLIRQLLAVVLAILAITAGSSPAVAQSQSATCQATNARASAIWQAFDSYVRTNYRPRFENRSYAYGHALGRLASAVDGNREKQEAFECAKKGIDQLFATGNFLEQMLDATSFRTAMETAYGDHDARVASCCGVRTRSPLHVVFDDALRLMGRSSFQPNRTAVAPRPPKRTPPVRTTRTPVRNSPPPVRSSGLPGGSSIKSCTAGGRWSLATARSKISSATALARRVGGDCRGNSYNTCRSISNLLHEARDHIFQTFDQNHDGFNKCRMCNFNIAKGEARRLIQWEAWLNSKYYRGAGGLANIYYTIDDNSRVPVCKAGRPPGREPTIAMNPSRTSSRTSRRPTTTGSAGPKHDCANPNIRPTAKWKFYRQIFGGGGTAYSEKRGKICYGRNYYYTFGGTLTGYKCTGEWQNCRADPAKRYPIVKTERNANGSVSYYWNNSAGQLSWGTRSKP